MSQRILTLKVDLSHPLVVHPIPGILGGGDCYADIIRVLVYQDGEPVQVTGTVTGYVMNQAGDTFTVSGAADGNGAQIQLPETAYELTGPITVAIRETRGTVRTTLAICSTAVKATTTGTEYDPGDMVPNIDNLREAWERAEAAAVAAEQKVQDFNDIILVQSTEPSSETNRIWVQPQADEYRVPSWEEFIGVAAGQIDFPSAPVQKYWDLAGTTKNPVSIGDVISGQKAGESWHYCFSVSGLVEGETFTITASDGASARPWGILDKDNVLRARASGKTVTNATVTVPEGCGGGTLVVQVRDENIGTASVVRNMNLMGLGTDIATNTAAITEINRRARREKGNIYLGSGVTVDITSAGSGSLAVSFSGRLNFKLLGDNGGAKDWADISSELTESQITIDGTTAVITIPDYYWLVYNTDDQQLYLRSNRGSNNYALQANDVVLLYNTYNQPVSGILHEKWLDQQARSADTRLTAAESRIAVLEGSMDSEALTAVAASLTEMQAASGSADSFLFFTDPHLCEVSNWKPGFEEWMRHLGSYYSQLPVRFALCGGDWMGHDDTPANARAKLSLIYTEMRRRFSTFHMCVGNHDTNEQGKATTEAARWTGRLDPQGAANIWYNGRSYYDFFTPSARYFILDTGGESNGNAYAAYYTAERAWLAEQLLANTAANIVFVQHIVYGVNEVTDGVPTTTTPQHGAASAFLRLAQAFNARGSVTLDGVTYNFEHATGKVRFVIAGHTHYDSISTAYDLPIWITGRTFSTDITSLQRIDLMVADFENGVVKAVRVGAAAITRTMTMA